MTEISPQILLSKALQRITDHPELWDQQEYHCGTSACLIGHMAELHPDFQEWESDAWLTIGGRSWWIEDWAMEFLDLEYQEFYALAAPQNTRTQLKAGVMAYVYSADIVRAVRGAA